MCISAPKTALVFQPCIDAQMAARGISHYPKSAVTGLDFSPRYCSKYLWLRFNASFPFLSLKQESPALLSAALRGLRCHPQSRAQPCRGQCLWVPWQCRGYTGGDDARRQRRAVPWAPAGFYTPCFNQAKEQTQRRAAARRNCLKRLRQQRPSWRVHFLGCCSPRNPRSTDSHWARISIFGASSDLK